MKNSPHAHVTFDDGPNSEITPTVLALLEKAEVVATFFLLGKHVEKHPDIVATIVQSGHEIGEHSYFHSHPWKTGPIGSFIDVLKGGRALKPYIKEGSVRLFRPPYGKLNLVTVLYILLFKKKVVFWDIDPKDYAQNSGEDVAQYVSVRIHDSSVLLLHDGRQNPEEYGAQVTTDALKLILEHAYTDKKEFQNIGDVI